MARIIKQQGVPSDKYGTRPEERSLAELISFGMVVIDKPSGPTSHQVSAYVQKILDIDKAGHAGTLDPKVTGVLPVGLGRATRLMEYMLQSGKQYVGVMHLHGDIPEYEVRKAAEAFIGRITQLPPKRSAVARRKRERSIYEFRFVEIRGRDILFVADVEAGTYIRKLCHDFGEHLKCGAHMAELRRTRAAHYTEDMAVTLQTLADAYHLAKAGDEALLRTMILPAEHVVEKLPAIVILDSAVHSITQGASLKMPGIAAVDEGIMDGDRVRLITLKDELVAIARARTTWKGLLLERGIAAAPEKVFMDPGVYPRME